MIWIAMAAALAVGFGLGAAHERSALKDARMKYLKAQSVLNEAIRQHDQVMRKIKTIMETRNG